MSNNSFDNPTPGRVLFWTVIAIVVLSTVGFGLNAVGLVGGTAIDRRVIEESRQYAATNVDGAVSPVYVESFVSVYPYPVEVDYDAGRVVQAGAPTVSITK